ncbi:hypothetical protein [Jiella avicenniae]|uniref:Uncharacterized protein n=1 Tax=Jiella avicenniae TaxID=2907202 RepID=A0A9X1P3X4_9HYPH|nr:hypothetical protein [Jiella avicenniae]MCE7031005.1 hypothetical protein [Jiella avicenniae]
MLKERSVRIDPIFVASLPDDKHQAFLEFEVYMAALRDENKKNDNSDWTAEQFYINGLNAYAISRGDDELQKVTNINIVGDDQPWYPYSNVINYVERRKALHAFSLGDERRKSRSAIGLSADVREQIHSYISNIRHILHQIDLPELKREHIFNALNRLAMEIDTNRTWVESVGEVVMRLTDPIDDINKKLAPAKKLFDKILKRLGESRDEKEALPAPEEQKRIEGPSTAKEDAANDLEDEIPF